MMKYDRIDKISYGFDGEEKVACYVLTGDKVPLEREINLDYCLFNANPLYTPMAMAETYTLPVVKKETVYKVHNLTELLQYMNNCGYEAHLPDETVIKAEIESTYPGLNVDWLIDKVVKATDCCIAIGSDNNENYKKYALTPDLDLKPFALIAEELKETKNRQGNKEI